MKYKIKVYEDRLALSNELESEINEACFQNSKYGVFVNNEHVFVLNLEDTKERLESAENIEEIEISEDDERRFVGLYNAEKTRIKRHNEIKYRYIIEEKDLDFHMSYENGCVVFKVNEEECRIKNTYLKSDLDDSSELIKKISDNNREGVEIYKDCKTHEERLELYQKRKLAGLVKKGY